ncbi:Crp/Fnr family transcriptional regulator [Sphingobacterium oryzagri]|uniref:Crp/Fnr family transcriptional regulator n=1 Tax=Sphingobacterium oryzagri TaxID=3025669 RepID=A0ABY7WGB9_9SPHI|nr:Crp/Fnr family transcriptional regulator [Sphingobacterium sp. KACC 22765]WDF67423.1 Crp/Fnr family transcriptional regulator [Sphingobacterium sp. KACC 22765]
MKRKNERKYHYFYVMNANFKAYCQKHGALSEAEIDLFYRFFTERKYKRNTILLRDGEVAHEVYFVLSGFLRQYFYNEDGLEKTCNFAFEAEFITDLESFSRQAKAATNVMTMEASTVLVISCKDLATAIGTSPAIAELCKTIVENVATENIRRIQSLLSSSPEKQYVDLVQSKPQIAQRVPQRYFAQYLGLAPESLSRIRKRMLRTEKP